MADFLVDHCADVEGTTLVLHTPDTGGAWHHHPTWSSGDGVISNLSPPTNVLLAPVSGQELAYNDAVPPTADYYVKFTATPTATLSGAYLVALSARYDSSADTRYQFAAIGPASGSFTLYSAAAGSYNLLGTTAHTFVSGTPVVMELIVNGSTITCKADGVNVCGTPLTDTAVTAKGFAGIRLADTNREWNIDEIFAGPLAAGTNITPDQGTLALTGPVPTIARLTDPHLIPGAGTIALTGPAPTVSYSITLDVGAGTLALTGPVPTVARSTDGPSVAPGQGAIALTGPVPQLGLGITIGELNEAYGVGGQIALTGPRPSVVNQDYNSNAGGVAGRGGLSVNFGMSVSI